MNKLSRLLVMSNVGCYIDGQCMNHLMYADDICILASTAIANKKDDCDMLRQLPTLYAKSNKIICTFSHCTIDVKLLLIKSYCTSFYCGYMWSDYKKTTYSKLRVAFNNVYRRVLGLSYSSSASTMYTTHNINNMEALLRKSIYSLLKDLWIVLI